METTFNVAITKPGGGIRFAKKKVDITFAPFVGMDVECSAWKSSRKIVAVTLSLEPETDEPSLFIELQRDNAKNEQDQEELMKMYKAHGWETID